MNNFSLNRYFVLGISAILLMVSFGYSQDNFRTVKEDNPARNIPPPIAVVDRTLKGQSFSFDEKVSADKDWLKDLKFTVKNISSKTIVFFEIELVVPKSEILTSRYAFPMRFGTPLFIWDDKLEPSYIDVKNRQLLRPNETVTVKVYEHALKGFTKSLQKRNADDFNSVIMNIKDVEFDDFSGWSYGNPWQRDSKGKIINSISIQ